MHSDLAAHWDRISPLLDEALALDPSARRAWLESLPASNADLRPLLARILGREAEAADFLARSPRPSDDAHLAGDRVGAYRLLSELGRGGMGVVWLAERVDATVLLPVALKLPYILGTTASVRERFERERAILAALNHPGIARLYEAGLTDSGQPYLAMELVEGEPLLEACRSVHDVRDRVAKFIKVLEAVQYAHASLVIHRDLKPSNIIVTRNGDVKLLDFGIAKLLDAETHRTAQTELTRMHGRPLTLDYASPEQVRGDTLTTATDVYSLGVVLFELLAGERPYRLKRGSTAELEEAILTADVVQPSQAATGRAISARRALRGDLDAIVLKALEKEPSHRYATVDSFIRDCEHFLARRPVLAHPQRATYRLRKFIGRNRLALTAASAVSVALVSGASVALWQSRLALEEVAKQRAVQAFLTELFDRNTRAQPDAAKAREMTVRELLLEASERVQGSFTDAPSVRLELLNTIARLLRDVDEYERAAVLGRAAVATAREHGLTGSDAYVESQISLAVSERLLGNGDAAVAAREASLRALDERGDHGSLLRARAGANTVAQFAPDIDREIQLVEGAAALFEQRYPTEPEYFSALYYLGNLHRTQGRAADAERWFRRAIAIFERSGSRDYTSLGACHAFVGGSEVWLGRLDDGLRSYETGLELLTRHAGAQALNTRFQRALYADALHSAGRPAEAHAQFQRVATDRPAGPPTIADFDSAVYQSWAFVEEGRPDAAIAALEPYAADFATFGRRYVPNGRRWAMQLAFARAMRGENVAAENALQRLSELPGSHYGETLDTSPDYLIETAWIAIARGDAEAAARILDRSPQVLLEEPVSFGGLFVRGQLRSAEVALARGRPEVALEHARRARSHLATRIAPGALPFLESRGQRIEGSALLALGRAPEAVVVLTAAAADMRRLHSPDSPWLLQALAALARAERQSGALAQAAAALAEARRVAGSNAALSPVFLTDLPAPGPHSAARPSP